MPTPQPTIRTANHVAMSLSSTSTAVHLAADGTGAAARRHILACNGRSIAAAAVGLMERPNHGATCKACVAGLAAGRIVVEVA